MVNNTLGRFVPEGKRPFVSSDDFLNHPHKELPKKLKSNKKVEFFSSLEDVFDYFHIDKGQTLSFHHHLRNGDEVINMVCEEVLKRELTEMNLVPSSIFPHYEGLAKLISNHQVHNLTTSYMNGPVSTLVQEGNLTGKLIMQTHGGRARSILDHETEIDVAFLATPAVDRLGNGNGVDGPSSCGTLGYAISDLETAKKVVLVTDYVSETELSQIEFHHEYVDAVLVVPSIGEREGIVSGTTKITRDPIGLKIAKETASLLDTFGYIREGFSMQTGAGGTSLAVVEYVKQLMKKKNIKGSFASGGITSSYVEMLEEGLFNELNDVQCFDLEAIRSLKENKNHHEMSASHYGNPFDQNPVCNGLDFVILGATEIDTDFNVNVTTDSFGRIIGGSGGHSDIAYGSKCSVVVSQLIKSRLSIVKDKVHTITSPGSDIDVFVCERGIAINPRREDLIIKAKEARIPLVSMQELLDLSNLITGVPRQLEKSTNCIGYIEYRDGTVIDSLYGVDHV